MLPARRVTDHERWPVTQLVAWQEPMLQVTCCHSFSPGINSGCCVCERERESKKNENENIPCAFEIHHERLFKQDRQLTCAMSDYSCLPFKLPPDVDFVISPINILPPPGVFVCVSQFIPPYNKYTI